MTTRAVSLTEILAEITTNIQDAENAGTVISATDTTARVRFHTVEHAAGWVRDYTGNHGAVFEQPPTTFTEPVIVRVNIAAYIETAGI